MNARTVLLYGQSLLLSGVAVSLAGIPNLCVSRATTWDEAKHMLMDRMPDVLIFDLSCICEIHVLSLLLKSPHPFMVGLDTEQSQAVLLTGQQARSLTLDQLVTIVEQGK